ncbi:hypothetical protein ABAC460_23630 [Asticcacaulis sp. AC460]|uniref:type II toxin-antitoxin system RelE/ParE family toxin n=1 Tax=Asticcacaulis sp. AC460 TaxID=1282360 RepID=UPI0003C3B944|nr:type II toxin-antitoxin system RelE/ParE family toxin [Asticcacaulis sp. AC460]ESQ85482.1 hypothetical protein ABAC460_23630 [Asticcacaulis sp. AC460]
MSYGVAYSRRAIQHLQNLHDFIANQGSPLAAVSFVGSIFEYCDQFGTFPQRGTARDDLRPDMRVVGFQRRATILFRIDDAAKRVVILGVYYGGQDYEAVIKSDADEE